MKSEQNVPQVRFKGFTDAWEQRKVGELTVESSEYTTLEAGFPLLTSSRNGLMYQNEYRGKQTTDSTETMFSIVPLGACTYRHMSDDDVFHLNVNRLEKGLVSREYPVFYASDDNNLDFIVQQINSSAEFRSFCAEQKKGGTRTRLYYKNLCEFQMLVPNTEEQEKIAKFLLTLDSIITLHQRKCDTLQKLKKSMLQKMFPKNGSLYPEIQFAGFTDAWEQRELGTIIKENLKPVSKPEGEYIRLGIRSHAKGTFHEVVPAGGGLNVDTMYAVEANNLIVNITFAWEEAWAITTDEDAEKLVSHRFPQYKFNSDQYPTFYKYRFNNARMKYDLELASPGGAGRNRVLNKRAFLKIPICIPMSYEEQQQIGTYFRNLDHLITLHQRKLETLKKLKKSMLQKMFI